MRSNSIIFMLLVFVGFLTAAAESNSQVVPPRSQTLQMIRPTTPPPVPPLQKEIKDVEQDVGRTKIELERKIEKEKTIRFLDERCAELQKKLEDFGKDPIAVHPDIATYPPNEQANVIQAYLKGYVAKIKECKKMSQSLKARRK